MKNQKKPRKRKISSTYKMDNMKLFLTSGYANEDCLKHFADEQLQFFIDNKKELQISAYRLTKGVGTNLYQSWKKKNEYFRKMHEFTLELLAHRRQKTLFSHNPNLITHTQYQYDEDWKKADERQDRRKKDIASVQENAPSAILFPSWDSVKTLEDAKKIVAERMKKDDKSQG